MIIDHTSASDRDATEEDGTSTASRKQSMHGM